LLESKNSFSLVATTLFGLEEILAGELKALGAENITVYKRAVGFNGNKRLIYAANLWCRTALRILMPIREFDVNNEQDLYNKISLINWQEYLDVKGTLAIDAVVNNSDLTHSKFVAQKTKDAIADQFRNKFGERPSVDLDNPSLRINIHIDKNHCTVALDSSGIPLFKRGYRQATGDAPINEVLAAGLILLSGWQKDCDFIDPMCGSGTMLIEAAMIANNIAPGNYRKIYGFMKWKDYDSALWNEILKDSYLQQTEFDYEICGSDISSRAIEIAKENIKAAGFHKDITLQVCAFDQSHPASEKGIIISNPPYGERLQQDDIIAFYKTIGDTLKKNYTGHSAWVISSDIEALKFIGLHPSRKIKIFNGQLECKFVRFDVYEGSKKNTQEENN